MGSRTPTRFRKEKTVTTIQKVSLGLSLVAIALFALPLHGTQGKEARAVNASLAQVGAGNMQPLNSPETEQALQWSMEYGDRLPPSSPQHAGR